MSPAPRKDIRSHGPDKSIPLKVVFKCLLVELLFNFGSLFSQKGPTDSIGFVC